MISITPNLTSVLSAVSKGPKTLGFDITPQQSWSLREKEAIFLKEITEKEFQTWTYIIPEEVDQQNWYWISVFNKEEICLSLQ